jgi:hypothetical protein
MKTNFMSKLMRLVAVFMVISACTIASASGIQQRTDGISDTGAMFRSFVLPGWGHYYVNPDSWNTGRIYLGTDIILIGAYFGFTVNANRLDNNLRSFAQQYAGTDIGRFGRSYRLNVGEYSTIKDYNDFQERSRNWDRIYSDVNQYFWSWESEQKRREFVQLNNKVDRNRQQLPALFSLMVVNRVISGIHAYNASRNYSREDSSLSASLYVSQPTLSNGIGYQATLNIRF